MTTDNLLPIIPVILAWTTVAYALPSVLRRRGEAAMRSFWLSLVCLALALTILVPAIYQAVDARAGIPNLARLLGNGLVIVTGWQSQSFMFRLNFPSERAERSIRRSGWLMAATLVLMSALFLLAPVHQEAVDFIGRYADAPFVLEYRLVYLAYVGWSLGAIVLLSWRYANLVPRPALRLGLRFNAVGGALGLGYIGHEALRVVVVHIGLGEPFPNPALVTQVLEAGAVTFLLVGSTMSAWGPRVGIPGLYDWTVRYRTYRHLDPLWRALYQACPEIALAPPRSAVLDTLDLRDLSFRLYRRVIEIRDGCLALRPYLDASVLDDARILCQVIGLSPQQAEPVVAAAGLAVALRAKEREWKAERPIDTIIPSGEGDLRSELDLLEQVAEALTRSSVVRTSRERAEERMNRRAGQH